MEQNGYFQSLIEITEDDRKEFPELNGYNWVLLTETNSGLVYCEAFREKPEVEYPETDEED